MTSELCSTGKNQLARRVSPFQRFTSLRLCLMHHYVFDYGRLVASVTSSLSSATRLRYVKASETRNCSSRVLSPMHATILCKELSANLLLHYEEIALIFFSSALMTAFLARIIINDCRICAKY